MELKLETVFFVEVCERGECVNNNMNLPETTVILYLVVVLHMIWQGTQLQQRNGPLAQSVIQGEAVGLSSRAVQG